MNIKFLSTAIAAFSISIIMNAQNPFFEKYNTPHQTAPFDKIKVEHFEPAIKEGMRLHKNEIDAIVTNSKAPTFDNTILALENSGDFLDRVMNVFGNLQGSETNDELLDLAQKLAPTLNEHSNNIQLNEGLFKRVKVVYDKKDQLGLNIEQNRLLDKTYKSFVRYGANLSKEDQQKYRKLSEKLNLLSLKFGQNNLKETNEYVLNVVDLGQLVGLPSDQVDAAAQTARNKNLPGWAFTLHAPSYIPFMKYVRNRDLRQQLYTAYNTKCTNNNDYNNLEIVKELVNTRMEIAQLLGYNSYAEYVLKERMAENSDAVYHLLNQLIDAYKPIAIEEYNELQDLARQDQGTDFAVMPWDWSFYSNQLQDKKYSINEEILRPYFELENVKKGVFGLATQLYGITFKKNNDIPVYHKDVDAYEVFDKDGNFLSVLYTDFHPRAGKRSGAWMTEYKGQWIDSETGENSRPHVSIVMNFTQPTETKPSLLTFDEFGTFLHEFGHALHGIFANSNYESLSGTSVFRDFVELPSQILENYATEAEFLNTFAKHYQTGENIPADLIQRIKDAANFNAAYACMRQVSFSLLDMAWYTLEKTFTGDVIEFEKEAWSKAQILPIVDDACMSAQFSHIFAGGYSAGYYSYKWAEVLDADAFSVFKEKGLFNQEVAESFRKNILSAGGTEHPMVIYKRFRGQEPTIDALLERNGIKK